MNSNELSTLINSIGLISDIVGGLILFKFGLPSEVSANGIGGISLASPDPIALAKYLHFKKWSRIGLSLVLIGFAGQLLATLIPSLPALLKLLLMLFL